MPEPGISLNAKASPGAPLLQIRDLEGGYGHSSVLHGIDIDVRKGEVVTLLGRNGAGKSTTLKAIMGVLSKRSGSSRMAGVETIDLRPQRVARLGIAMCPEHRGIFSRLTVLENLLLPPVIAPGGLTVRQVFELFPNLQERLQSRGTTLSGGEQQMLAIGRILRTGARLLLLDEPSEGLAPVVIEHIENTLVKLKALGFTIILVEQNLGFATAVADRHYVIEQGKVVDELSASSVMSDLDRLHRHLGV